MDVRIIGGTATGITLIVSACMLHSYAFNFAVDDSPSQIVFSQFSDGGTRRGVTIRPRFDSISGGSETIILEASSDDWPFTIGENSTTVTINECPVTPSTSRRFNVRLLLILFNWIFLYAENLFFIPNQAASEGSGVLTTYVHLTSGVGTLTDDLIVDISTSSNSAIGK